MTPLDVPELCGVDDEGCVTCGDVAVALRVVSWTDDGDARCTDERGRTEIVATTLVGDVAVGATVLVHARVAIALLDDASGQDTTACDDGGITT